MTVSGPFIDPLKPRLPYTLSVRYAATNSLIEFHRHPSEGVAIGARHSGRELVTRGRRRVA